jgi:UrcA family protein
MINPNRFILGLAVLVLPATLWAADLAAAVSTEGPPSVTVRYDDLTLKSSPGVAGLYQRIRGAASEVCQSFEGREPLEWQAIRKDCFAQAVANAVRAVHSDALSAYHWQQVRQHRTHESDTPAVVVRR